MPSSPPCTLDLPPTGSGVMALDAPCVIMPRGCSAGHSLGAGLTFRIAVLSHAHGPNFLCPIEQVAIWLRHASLDSQIGEDASCRKEERGRVSDAALRTTQPSEAGIAPGSPGPPSSGSHALPHLTLTPQRLRSQSPDLPVQSPQGPRCPRLTSLEPEEAIITVRGPLGAHLFCCPLRTAFHRQADWAPQGSWL